MPDAPRLLLVSLDRWLHPVRLPRALRDAGFAVEACAFGDDLLLASRASRRTYQLKDELKADVPRLIRAVAGVMREADPALVIPVDDSSGRMLARTYALAGGQAGAGPLAIAALIRRSLGDPARYAELGDKHQATALAAGLGLPVPAQAQATDLAAVAAFAAAHGWPLVLKSQVGGAGRGVAICADPAAAAAALPAMEGTVMAQAHVAGQPATFAGVAWQGRLLAGTGFTKAETWNGGTGPGSVLDAVDHAGMREAAARLIEKTGYTGFFDLDFLLDAAGTAWFIECNPRVVPVSHAAGAFGQDLAGALHAAMTGGGWAPGPARATRIALFPHEVLRDPRSPHLRGGAWHDVPWDEPAVLQAYVARMAGGLTTAPGPAQG